MNAMQQEYDCKTCPAQWCAAYPIKWYCYRKEVDTTRFYKGEIPVTILIKGKRKGKRGPITYLVREIGTGKEYTTIPRLLWKKPRLHHAHSTINPKP